VSAIRRDARPVSLVIPTLEGGERFLELLDALAHQDIEGGFEMVVFDSGSKDGTPEAAAAAGAYVRRIDPADFNHGATRNLAINETHGDIVALLTQDAVPMEASYLRKLAAAFDRDPNIAGVYARQFPRADCDPLLAERLRQWSATREEPEVRSFAAGDPAASGERWGELEPLERYLACAFDNVASAVRRSAWEEFPLPPRSFGEDVAWARKVLLAGRAIAFEPEARVEHSHRIDMIREFKRIYCDHSNLHELFGLRNVATWKAVRAGWRWQIGFYARLLAGQESLSRSERLYWRAYSIPYALLETAAQFLGARSRWKGDKSRFWRLADRRIRAGV
jgi:glycosyltransferase involved in cell wall biosynthesis